jgi:hypothetical protein
VLCDLSQGHCSFHSFPVVDWFCLFISLWVLTFPLEDCSEFGNFVITLIDLPLTSIVNHLHQQPWVTWSILTTKVNVKTRLRHTLIKKYFWHFCWLPYLYTFSLYENPSLSTALTTIIPICSSIVINTVIVTAGTVEP